MATKAMAGPPMPAPLPGCRALEISRQVAIWRAAGACLGATCWPAGGRGASSCRLLPTPLYDVDRGRSGGKGGASVQILSTERGEAHISVVPWIAIDSSYCASMSGL